MIYDDLSLYLAKLIGLTIFIMGLAMVFNKLNFQKTAQEISHSHALMTLIAILPLVLGLAMILAHNVWVFDWPVIVTIVGWLIFICGILRLFFHNYVMKMLEKVGKSGKKFLYGGVIMIILGAILAYMGFTKVL
jgi:uncharacterized membrane protein